MLLKVPPNADNYKPLEMYMAFYKIQLMYNIVSEEYGSCFQLKTLKRKFAQQHELDQKNI